MLVHGPIIGHLWLWPIYNTKNQASSPFLVLVFSDGPERKPKKKSFWVDPIFFFNEIKKSDFFFFFGRNESHMHKMERKWCFNTNIHHKYLLKSHCNQILKIVLILQQLNHKAFFFFFDSNHKTFCLVFKCKI